MTVAKAIAVSYLSGLTPDEIAELLKEKQFDPIFERVYTCCFNAVEISFQRHGFKVLQSDTSVVHSVTASQTERDRHTARMLALSNLLVIGKEISVYLSPADQQDREVRMKLDLAIAAVEREFKQ